MKNQSSMGSPSFLEATQGISVTHLGQIVKTQCPRSGIEAVGPLGGLPLPARRAISRAEGESAKHNRWWTNKIAPERMVCGLAAPNMAF
jgi:hypothetical protein